MSFPVIKDQPVPRFSVGDLVAHMDHDHLAGIILDLEYVRYQVDSRMPRYGSKWKAWIEWNGNASTKDFVDCEYLIKLM